MKDAPITSNVESVPLLFPRQSPFREASTDMYDSVSDELDVSHSHNDIHGNAFTPSIPSTVCHPYTAATGLGHTNPPATANKMASTALVLRLKHNPGHGFYK